MFTKISVILSLSTGCWYLLMKFVNYFASRNHTLYSLLYTFLYPELTLINIFE